MTENRLIRFMDIRLSKLDWIRSFGFALALAAFAFLLPIISSANAAALVAHRAVYDLKLDRADDGKGISDVNGRMVFEFIGNVCDGYTVNMRYRTNFANTEGRVVMSDIQSTTWEAGDSESFSFSTRQFMGADLSDETRGSATRGDDRGDISIKLSQPNQLALRANAETMFPTQHFLALIEAALKGKRFFQMSVYDGSNEGDKVYDTNAVIGAAQESVGGAEEEKISTEINGITVWPVSIAYFEEAQDGEQLPTYQISFDLYENGVSRQLVLDYGDFVLKGTMVSLEILDQSACDTDKPN